jgi:hypothetical protein
MNNQVQFDDYFSQAAIKRRINTHQRRQLFFVIHLLLVLAVTAFIIFDSVQVIQFISESWPTNDVFNSFWTNFSGPSRLIVITAGWLTLPLHYVWIRSRLSAERQLDTEMREVREYELRRYELDHDRDRDAAYRLGDDGELFDDINHMDVEMKPKRKQKQ